MTLSNELYYAILAMDAYNRGPDDDNKGLIVIDNTAVGNATIEAVNGPQNDPDFTRAFAAGFFASAYDLNGQTIISFRGTDFDPNKIAAAREAGEAIDPAAINR